MRIYTNEINNKHYIRYSAAVLSALELGFELVRDIDDNQKAVLCRPSGGLFGGPKIEHGYISYMDTVDECPACAIIELVNA